MGRVDTIITKMQEQFSPGPETYFVVLYTGEYVSRKRAGDVETCPVCEHATALMRYDVLGPVAPDDVPEMERQIASLLEHQGLVGSVRTINGTPTPEFEVDNSVYQSIDELRAGILQRKE